MLEPNHAASLDIERAYHFYREEILGSVTSRSRWYEEYGFKNPRTTSGDWEVFGAVLLRQKRSSNPYGHDLEGAEVKSCGPSGSGFEYQYHKKGGLAKLESEANINHVFVLYSDDYLQVTVYLVRGAELKSLFDSWRDGLVVNYESGLRQRFRRSIPKRAVTDLGRVVLRISVGELDYPKILP